MTTRYEIAYLAQPPELMRAGDGLFTDQHGEWLQDKSRWTVFYYHHANALTIGVATYPIAPGTIAFIPPGKRCAHARIGDGTWFDFQNFILPAQSGVRMAVPHVMENMEYIKSDFRIASNRIVDTGLAASAFSWQLLWNASKSLAVFRGEEAMYEAEAYILQHLGEKISIPSMCESLDVTSRRLLHMFRTEHNVSIQEYILQKRVQEATRRLVTSEDAIKNIAVELGFADLQYFNKVMRAMTGRSPRAIRDLSETTST